VGWQAPRGGTKAKRDTTARTALRATGARREASGPRHLSRGAATSEFSTTAGIRRDASCVRAHRAFVVSARSFLGSARSRALVSRSPRQNLALARPHWCMHSAGARGQQSLGSIRSRMGRSVPCSRPLYAARNAQRARLRVDELAQAHPRSDWLRPVFVGLVIRWMEETAGASTTGVDHGRHSRPTARDMARANGLEAPRSRRPQRATDGRAVGTAHATTTTNSTTIANEPPHRTLTRATRSPPGPRAPWIGRPKCSKSLP